MTRWNESRFCMERKQKTAIAIAITIVIILIVIWVLRGEKTKPQINNKTVAVEVSVAKRDNWRQPLQAIGTVKSGDTINLTAETNGRVIAIYFKPPTTVKKGQLLYHIFNADLQAQLQSAQADLRNSERNFRRTEALNHTTYASAAELDKAQQSYLNDKAKVKQYQALLSQTLIRAPIAGTIGYGGPNVGEAVQSGDFLATITPKQLLRVDFTVPARYINSITPGQTVYLYDSENHLYGKSQVISHNNTVNPDSQQIMVRSVTNKNPALQSGQTVKVLTYVGNKQPVFVVPETAIYYQLGGAYLYKVEKQKAVQVPVKVIQLRDNTVGVSGKLHNGDRIIRYNDSNIRQGVTVNIIQS